MQTKYLAFALSTCTASTICLQVGREMCVCAMVAIARPKVRQARVVVNLSMKPLRNYFIRNRFIVAINRFYVWLAAITRNSATLGSVKWEINCEKVITVIGGSVRSLTKFSQTRKVQTTSGLLVSQWIESIDYWRRVFVVKIWTIRIHWI